MELELSLSPPNQKIKKSCDRDDRRATRFSPVSWNHEEQANSSLAGRDLDDDGEGLIWRKRLMEEGDHVKYELFVKVKMDGVGIARKIDLNAFHSYQTLTTALLHTFAKVVEIEEDGASFKLMYQDRDGHWHLGGDLPWEMFIRSVKRIQMVRNGTIAN